MFEMFESRKMSAYSNGLSGIRIGNFKAFAESQEIPIRPLTLIYGANSAGKSSIIHSLLLVNQALNNGNVDVHQTKIGGESVDLGGFKQYIHRHDLNRLFEWGMEFEHEKIENVVRYLGGFSKAAVTFRIGVSPDDEGSNATKTPSILAFDLALDGCTFLKLERKPTGMLHSIGMNYEHPVFRSTIEKLVQDVAKKISDKKCGTMCGGRHLEELLSDSGQLTVIEKQQAVEKKEAFQRSKEAEFARLMDQWAQITEVIDADISTVPFEVSHFFPHGLPPEGEECTYAYAYRDYDPDAILDSLDSDVEGDYCWIARVLRFEIEKLFHEYREVFTARMRRLSYLGPLRCYPPRHLTGMHDQEANWFSGGGQAWETLRRDPEVLRAVNHWLIAPDRLTKHYKLEIRELADLRNLVAELQAHLEISLSNLRNNSSASIIGQAESVIKAIMASHPDATLSEIVLQDISSKTEVSHRDVGQGITQVLPVLVNAFGSRNQTIAIEQPELHLHPALQAELGDVFIDSALGEQSNTILLESHSEHLLLRIMRRMRETHNGTLPVGKHPVKPCDVAVLYVETVGTRSIVREMSLNERGELIKDWPGGFFEEGLREVLT